MITINLVSSCYQPHITDDGVFSLTDNRTQQLIKFVVGKPSWGGVTLFTDKDILQSHTYNSKYKIAWIIEPPEINSLIYNNIPYLQDNFDLVLTYNMDLVKKYNFTYCPYGGCWIQDDNYKIFNKDKLVSMFYSNKRNSSGHKFRHEVSHLLNNKDLYGSGCNKPFLVLDDFLLPYMFSVVIENSKIPGYFSEKILNCFAVGTIPIYWGDPLINDRFDNVITFDNKQELSNIINNITPEDYYKQKESIHNNFIKFKNYDSNEKSLYKELYKFFLSHDIKLDDPDINDERTRTDNELQNYWLNKFRTDNGEEKVLKHNLNTNSLVLDFGSYQGEFYSEIYNRYNCNIHALEPINQFYKTQPLLDKVINHNFTISCDSKPILIYKNDNSSSCFGYGETEECITKTWNEFLIENNIKNIDLLKLNVEGVEYSILELMLNDNILPTTILVQFHFTGYDPQTNRKNIINRLLDLGYNTKWSYPFVWECFTRE